MRLGLVVPSNLLPVRPPISQHAVTLLVWLDCAFVYLFTVPRSAGEDGRGAGPGIETSLALEFLPGMRL
jgi:hypothetical protein